MAWLIEHELRKVNYLAAILTWRMAVLILPLQDRNDSNLAADRCDVHPRKPSREHLLVGSVSQRFSPEYTSDPRARFMKLPHDPHTND